MLDFCNMSSDNDLTCNSLDIKIIETPTTSYVPLFMVQVFYLSSTLLLFCYNHTAKYMGV